MPTNRYAELDPAITAWADHHQLQVATQYKDYEVRSVDIPRRTLSLWRRPPFQIWIDEPDSDGFVAVHAWDRERQRFERRVRADGMRAALEEALEWTRSHA